MKTIFSALVVTLLLTSCGKSVPDSDTLNPAALQDLIWTDTLDGHGISIAGTGLVFSQNGKQPNKSVITHSRDGRQRVPLKDIGLDYFNCVHEDYSTKNKTNYYTASVSATVSFRLKDVDRTSPFLSAKNGGRRFYTIKGIGVEEVKYSGTQATVSLETSDGKSTGFDLLFGDFIYEGTDGRNSIRCVPQSKLTAKQLVLVLQKLLQVSDKAIGTAPAGHADDLNQLMLGYRESGFTAAAEPLVLKSESLMPASTFKLADKTFPGVRKKGDSALFCDNVNIVYQGETSTTDVRTDVNKAYRFVDEDYFSNSYRPVEERNGELGTFLGQQQDGSFARRPNFSLVLQSSVFAGLPVPTGKAPIDRLAKFDLVKERIAKAVTACTTIKAE